MNCHDPDEPPGYRESLLEFMREFARTHELTLVIKGDENHPIRLETLERDGETLLVFPDSDRHERRVQRWLSNHCDRVYWATLTIACGSPGKATNPGAPATNLAKRFGSLPSARNDVDAFYQYYQPMRLGEPIVAMPGMRSVLSPGYYAQTIPLDNPTVSQLVAAIERLGAWLKAKQQEPEFKGYQFNFCFSGHGTISSSDKASVVLADAEVSSVELSALLLHFLPSHDPIPVRLDLYLDCCHSGAVARNVLRDLDLIQRDQHPQSEPWIVPGQVYCACLDDEESFEFSNLAHGVFTHSFLNECSRKQPPGSDEFNLGLRDVGWFTGGRQHPMLLDFSGGEGFDMKFPSRYYLTNPPRADLAVPAELRPQIDPERALLDPVGESLRIARAYRSLCQHSESAVYGDSTLRKDFSREELRTNARFPFL